MNEKKVNAPNQLKSLKLVRETLRELGAQGTTPEAMGPPLTRGHRCTYSFAG